MPPTSCDVLTQLVNSMPERVPMRIQRRRVKGWRKPPNTVYCGRPGPWGNPFRAKDYEQSHYLIDGTIDENPMSRKDFLVLAHGFAVDDFESALRQGLLPFTFEDIRRELRGYNLMDWCALCEEHTDGRPWNVTCDECAPCHVDVLIRVANL